MSNDNGRIDYAQMIDDAMRGVVRAVLTRAAKSGLPGEHHFYVSFYTAHPGVSMSEALRQKYPHEMTIVIQHQFWDLKVEEEQFSVMLSFNNIPEKLVVPFAALSAFADPSIKFGLQFHQTDEDEEEDDAFPSQLSMEEGEATPATEIAEGGPREASAAEIITLDAFRKKK